MLTSPCRANLLLTHSRFVQPTDGNAIALSEALEHASSATVAESSSTPLIWTKESQAVAPSASLRGPPQKPSRNLKNGAPRREIDFVFLNSGRRTPPSNPSTPLPTDRSELTPWSLHLLPPPGSFSIAIFVNYSFSGRCLEGDRRRRPAISAAAKPFRAQPLRFKPPRVSSTTRHEAVAARVVADVDSDHLRR